MSEFDKDLLLIVILIIFLPRVGVFLAYCPEAS